MKIAKNRKCNKYNINAYPCNQNCPFLHLSDREMVEINHSKHKLYDAKIKEYDKNNQILIQNGIISTYNLKTRRVEPMVIKSGGVLLYAVEKGRVKVLLGYEKVHGRFKLFGGMRDVSKDNNCIDTALRECSEEIYGAFDMESNICNCQILLKSFIETQSPLWNKYSEEGRFLLLLLKTEKFPCEKLKSAEIFHKKKKKKERNYTPEKSDYAWVDYLKLMNNRNMIIYGIKKKNSAKVKQYDYDLLKSCKKTFMAISNTTVTSFSPQFHNKSAFYKKKDDKMEHGFNPIKETSLLKQFSNLESDQTEALEELKESNKKIKFLQANINQYAKKSLLLEKELQKKTNENAEVIKMSNKFEKEKNILEEKNKDLMEKNNLILQELEKIKIESLKKSNSDSFHIKELKRELDQKTEQLKAEKETSQELFEKVNKYYENEKNMKKRLKEFEDKYKEKGNKDLQIIELCKKNEEKDKEMIRLKKEFEKEKKRNLDLVEINKGLKSVIDLSKNQK